MTFCWLIVNVTIAINKHSLPAYLLSILLILNGTCKAGTILDTYLRCHVFVRFSKSCCIQNLFTLLNVEVAEIIERTHTKSDDLGKSWWETFEEQNSKESEKCSIASNAVNETEVLKSFVLRRFTIIRKRDLMI